MGRAVPQVTVARSRCWCVLVRRAGIIPEVRSYRRAPVRRGQLDRHRWTPPATHWAPVRAQHTAGPDFSTPLRECCRARSVRQRADSAHPGVVGEGQLHAHLQSVTHHATTDRSRPGADARCVVQCGRSATETSHHGRQDCRDGNNAVSFRQGCVNFERQSGNVGAPRTWWPAGNLVWSGGFVSGLHEAQ
jgi:hypothetical protein